jgi:hypothetical protein
MRQPVPEHKLDGFSVEGSEAFHYSFNGLDTRIAWWLLVRMQYLNLRRSSNR